MHVEAVKRIALRYSKEAAVIRPSVFRIMPRLPSTAITRRILLLKAVILVVQLQLLALTQVSETNSALQIHFACTVF